MEDICPKLITIEPFNKNILNLPISAARRSSIGPCGSEDGTKSTSRLLGLLFNDVGGDSVEDAAGSYLADAIKDETESRTPLVVDSRALEPSLVAVAICRGCN